MSLLLRSVYAVLLLLLASPALSSRTKFQKLKDWIEGNGGQVNADVGVNQHGVRGLFAAHHLYVGDLIASVPTSCTVQVSPMAGNTLLQLTTSSHFASYLNMMPQRQDVVNACNLPSKYLPLLESSHWGSLVTKWQEHLQKSVGAAFPEAESLRGSSSTFNESLSLEDLQYACTLTFTRALKGDDMGNGQLIPVVDLANHRRNCPNLVSSDVENGVMQFHAGEEIGAGTEICLSYHPSLRDDFAFIHYGFLPEEECPPRLFMEDHVEFDEMFLEYQPFQGSVEQMREEVARLRTLHRSLSAGQVEKQYHCTWADLTAASSRSVSGECRDGYEDPIITMLLQLHERRLIAISYEIYRLSLEIAGQTGEEPPQPLEGCSAPQNVAEPVAESVADSNKAYGNAAEADADAGDGAERWREPTQQQQQQQEQEEQQQQEQQQQQEEQQEQEQKQEGQQKEEQKQEQEQEGQQQQQEEHAAPSHEVAEAEDKQRKDREQEAARDWFPELVDWNLRKKFTALKKWVTDHKGTVGATMGVEESGARTLLAAQDFKAGQEIVVVTTDTIISIWKFEDVVYFQKFVTPTYYQKYVDMMPSLDMNELTNVCNLQKKYHPLLQSNHWAATVVNWQNDMDRQLVNSSRYKNAVRLLEVPIREYMTSDLQRACTMILSRRVFNNYNRGEMLLLPIIDMARHKKNCPHQVVTQDDGATWRLVAGSDLKAGEEICFNYKDNMRDDYAFLHYGFIPEEEYPPQMFLVDHHNFGSDLAVTEELFSGSVEEMEGEIERLEVIKKMMAKTAAKGRFENMDDSDPVVRDLLELQRRRKVALQYEIGRLSDELIVLELQEQHGKPEAQSVYEE